MKKDKAKSRYRSFRYYQNDRVLFLRLIFFLEADLAEPEVEAAARALLQALRERGYAISGGDLDDPDCLICLYESLLSAANIGHGIEKLKSEGAEVTSSSLMRH